MSYITTAKKVIKDFTKTFDYRKLVKEEIHEYCNVEVTKDLKEGGIHAFKAWEYWFGYLQENIWHTNLHEEIVTFANNIHNPKILSLGCGYGGHELNIARSLRKPFEMVASDLNARLFDKAINEAEKNKFNIKFEAVDLNFIQIRENCFDIIFAHASLHHILNLENLFYQAYKGLKNEGRFIVADIIGKTNVLFWKENVDFAREVVSEMPSEYKPASPNHDMIIPPYVEPLIQKGMEGIRQEEIESQISQYFTPVKIFKYGSFIRMICTNTFIGERINPEIKEDRDYLESLFNLDLKMIEENKLRPTEMFAVFRKKNPPDTKEREYPKGFHF